jgi:hypothetical protein
MRFLGTLPSWMMPTSACDMAYNFGPWIVTIRQNLLEAYNLITGSTRCEPYANDIRFLTYDGFVVCDTVGTHFLHHKPLTRRQFPITQYDLEGFWLFDKHGYACQMTSRSVMTIVTPALTKITVTLRKQRVDFVTVHSGGSTFLVVACTPSTATLYNVQHNGKYVVVFSVRISHKWMILGATSETIIYNKNGGFDVWAIDKTFTKRHLLRGCGSIFFLSGLIFCGKDVYKTTSDGLRWAWISACVF